MLLLADPSLSSLQRYQSTRSFRAKAGGPGEGGNRHGADGSSLILTVPVGTAVYDQQEGRLLGDLDREGSQLVAARGGRGGRGNVHYATPTHQSPRRRELGEPGQSRVVRLELRLIADVGIVGLPNAGKSTLLRALTAARPKVADYPFTTLTPNLGVAEVEGLGRITVADVPGLIEGAHEGSGLGTAFLRHLERTRALIHLVDATLGPEGAVQAYRQVQQELELHSRELAEKPVAIGLNKVDLVGSAMAAEVLGRLAAESGRNVVPVSAATGEGCAQLLEQAASMAPPSEAATAGEFRLYRGPAGLGREFRVNRVDAGFLVEGEWLERQVDRVDLDDSASVLRLQRLLRRSGVERALAVAGATAGDEVTIGHASFTYLPDEESGGGAPR